jgi:hypothetical protein
MDRECRCSDQRRPRARMNMNAANRIRTMMMIQ